MEFFFRYSHSLSVLGTNMPVNILFPNTLNLCSSIRVTGHNSDSWICVRILSCSTHTVQMGILLWMVMIKFLQSYWTDAVRVYCYESSCKLKSDSKYQICMTFKVCKGLFRMYVLLKINIYHLWVYQTAIQNTWTKIYIYIFLHLVFRKVCISYLQLFQIKIVDFDICILYSLLYINFFF